MVISASHNPYEDNGLKLFQGDGYKCSDALELELEALILEETLRREAPAGKTGLIEIWTDGAARYADLAVKAYGRGLDLHGVRVVVDAGHGAAYLTTPLILRALGADVRAFNIEPDGKNINAGCGSMHPELIAKATPENGAQIGLAHDGDADRLICCDETGSLLDGDEMLAVIGLDFLRRGELAKKTLVATVMSNLGLDECFAAAGGKVLRTGVGDRYVLEAMLEHDLNVGGEQSGHVILRDYNTTGDGPRHRPGAFAHHAHHRPAAEPAAAGPAKISAAPRQPEGARADPAGANAGSHGDGAEGGDRIGRERPDSSALLGHRGENPAARGDPRPGAFAAGR